MSFHKLDKAKDKNFWSVRVSSDIRLIVHKTRGSLLLCYVDHHDKAYDWAERRKLETHPKTGAAQLVEIRETVQEIVVPVYVEAERRRRRPPRSCSSPASPTTSCSATACLPEWLDDVQNADRGHAARPGRSPAGRGGRGAAGTRHGRQAPRRRSRCRSDGNPFDHPDAQRRFRVMDECRGTCSARSTFPGTSGRSSCTPSSGSGSSGTTPGPARVSGSAGTGKTIVALHRAAHLARTNPDARVLLTTFSDTLANALQTKLRRLVEQRAALAERIDVHSLDAIGLRLYKAHVGPATLAGRDVIARTADRGRAQPSPGTSSALHFLLTEWEQVVDAWQLDDLGGVSRCRAAGPEDPAAGAAARGPVVDLRARSRRADSRAS